MLSQTKHKDKGIFVTNFFELKIKEKRNLLQVLYNLFLFYIAHILPHHNALFVHK